MKTESISNWRLAAFASPATASSAVHLPLIVYIPAYYATDLGFGLAYLGAVFGFTKVWDVVTDPAVGIVTDRYANRWGRRRAWLALGALIMFVFAILLFFPQRFHTGDVSGAYLVVVLLGLYTGYTFFTVSHTAWAAELSDDYHNRTRIQGWLAWFGVAGSFAVMALPALIEQLGQTVTYQERVEAMGWFMAVALPVTVLLAVTTVGESHYKPVTPIGFRTAVKALMTNGPMARIVLSDFLLAFPAASRASMYVFFFTSVLERPEFISVVLLAYFATGPISIPFWTWVSRKVGKHKAVAYGLMAHALAALMYLLPGKGDVLLYVCIHLFSALVYGGHSFLIRAMVADVADADNVETGQQRTGLYYSLVTMSSKVGIAIGVGLLFPLLAMIGYDPSGENSVEVINRFRYLFVTVPFVAEVVVAWIIYRYPLDEATQQELVRRIAERDVSNA